MSKELQNRLEKLVRHRDQWTPIDKAIYGVENLYHVETGRAEQLRFEALKYSFSHHFQNNGFYRRLCQHEGVSPADISKPKDLYKIPLIPDTFFKDYPTGVEFYTWLQKIASVKLPEVKFNKRNPSFDDVIETLSHYGFTVTYTSGSSGRFSFFPRDELTWLRQKYCFASFIVDRFRNEFEIGDPQMIHLLAFSNPYKTNLYTGKANEAVIGTIFDKENTKFIVDIKVTTETIRRSRGQSKGIKEKLRGLFTKDNRKNIISDLYNLIQKYSKEGRKLAIAGPPFIMDALLSALEARGERLQLGENAWLDTGGGWKLPKGGAVIGSDWRARVEKVLGIPQDHCRDGYGMSECSAFFAPCEGHYKHIPHSVVLPFLLDDELKPIRDGNEGRLALLDPVTNSYPGFIITGDKVKIYDSCPVCNKPGPVFDPVITRIGGVESRGCGEIAAQLISEELEKVLK